MPTLGKRVVLVMPMAAYQAEDFLEAARRAGIEVVVASDRCPVLDKRYLWPASQVAIDFYDPEASVAAIVEAARGGPEVAAVLPGGGEAAALVAAMAAERLGLVGNPVRAAAATRNKRLLREALGAGGVAQPKWFAIESPARDAWAAQHVEKELGWPVVVKPLLLSGSRGVIRADNAGELAAALARLRRIVGHPAQAELDAEYGEQVLVEAFVPGREVALEGLVSAGELGVLALFDKPDPLEGPFFEETLYVTPSRLPAAEQAAIARVCGEAVRALGIQTGPVHAELRLGPDGPCVIEIAARTIGGLCARILRFGTGMSLEELVLRHAVGEPEPAAERERAAAGVMMIPIPGPGVLKAVDGVEDAKTTTAVGALIDDIVISARIGEELVPLPEGQSYLGFIFARGLGPDHVEAALRSAHRHLHFTIAKTLPVQ